MVLRANWADRAAAFSVVACGVLLGGHLIWYAAGWGSETLRAAAADAVYIPVALTFTVLGVRAARNSRLTPRMRLAWRFIAASFVCLLAGHTSWFVEDTILHVTRYPSVNDHLFLASIPFMLVGLLLLPGPRRSRRDRIKLALDSLIVGMSAAMVLWYLVLGPIFATEGASLADVAYSAALPIGDLLQILALASVLLRRPRSVSQTPVRLLAGAITIFVVADVYYGYAQLHAGFVAGTWPDVCWLLGCYLLVLAAYLQYRQAQGDQLAARVRRTAVNWPPYGAVALAYGLMGVLAQEQDMYPFGGMVIGAAALTFLVVARQMYALRENRDLAVTDGLTGLANRTLMTERLAQLSDQPLRDGRHSAVLLIDLDHFKPINDTYGHEAGDAVLTAVATELRAVVRAGDTAGRLGGDEFAVILRNLPSRETAAGIAERLVAALRTPVVFGDQVLAVEASIGVAIRDEASADGEGLLQNADAAMYAAKRSGRGRYTVYSAELDTRARDMELRRAIAAGELVVHYQPAVALSDEQIVAVEALVRWEHPTRGLLMPGEFIDLAEETGAIVPLGEWVLRASCRQVAQWRAEILGAEEMYLSVNLSPRQVVQASLVEVIRGILEETGFPADRLILELTESVILEPDPLTVTRLEALRDMGIRIGVDDFGTGYSALSYLRRLPVLLVKIDRSFVTGIEDDPQAHTVAEAVVRLGAAFRLTVVAEGIETAEQATALRDMGCEFGQGFYFHRPLDGETAARTLREAYRGRSVAPASRSVP